jgi:hypothetical protein
VGVTCISNIAATGNNDIVNKPRSHQICGLKKPRIHPAIRSEIIVGKNLRFSIAVAITGNRGALLFARIPPGMRYGGSTIKIKPRIGAKIKVNVSRILFFGILFPSL